MKNNLLNCQKIYVYKQVPKALPSVLKSKRYILSRESGGIEVFMKLKKSALILAVTLVLGACGRSADADPVPAPEEELQQVQEDQETVTPAEDTDTAGTGRRSTPGSTAFVPSVAGLIIAGEVIKDLTHKG